MLAIQNGRSNPVRISWKRSEKVNVAPLLPLAREAGFAPHSRVTSTAQSFANVFGRHPGDTNDFIPAAETGRNGNGTSWQVQKFGEEFDAGLVGAAFDGGRCQ